MGHYVSLVKGMSVHHASVFSFLNCYDVSQFSFLFGYEWFLANRVWFGSDFKQIWSNSILATWYVSGLVFEQLGIVHV